MTNICFFKSILAVTLCLLTAVSDQTASQGTSQRYSLVIGIGEEHVGDETNSDWQIGDVSELRGQANTHTSVPGENISNMFVSRD